MIKEVPAEVCTNCGYYYLSSEMDKLVLEKEKEAYSYGTELEVVELRVA